MELSDADVKDLKRLRHIESKLLNSPVRKKFFQVYKEADPTVVIPELEEEQRVQSAVDERVKALEKDISDVRKAQIERDAEEANLREKTRLSQAPFNLSDSEIDQVIQFRGEAYKNGEVLTLETAARAWIQQHQIPAGRSVGPKFPWSTKHQRPKDDFRKMLADPKSELFKDPRGVTARMADEARNEIRDAFGECVV